MQETEKLGTPVSLSQGGQNTYLTSGIKPVIGSCIQVVYYTTRLDLRQFNFRGENTVVFKRFRKITRNTLITLKEDEQLVMNVSRNLSVALRGRLQRRTSLPHLDEGNRKNWRKPREWAYSSEMIEKKTRSVFLFRPPKNGIPVSGGCVIA